MFNLCLLWFLQQCQSRWLWKLYKNVFLQENCGLDKIIVRDNGTGLQPSEVACVAKKHYTSKLTCFDDLNYLTTYGFRGEALGMNCHYAGFKFQRSIIIQQSCSFTTPVISYCGTLAWEGTVPSVIWHCWLGDRKGIWPVKTEWWGAGMVICLEWGADLCMAQLMPLPLTACCFSKIQIGFTFLVAVHPGTPVAVWQPCELLYTCYLLLTP